MSNKNLHTPGPGSYPRQNINANSGPKTIQKKSFLLCKAGAPKNPANPRRNTRAGVSSQSFV